MDKAIREGAINHGGLTSRVAKYASNHKGMTIIAVIFLLIAIAGMGIAVSNISISRNEQVVNSIDVQVAYFTARSGIEWAVQFSVDNGWSTMEKLENLNQISYPTLPNGERFTLVYNSATDTLSSTSRVGNAERRLFVIDFLSRIGGV